MTDTNTYLKSFLSLAEGKGRALAAAREIDSGRLEAIVTNLLEIQEEVLAAEHKEKAELEKREQIASEILNKISESGLTLSEIISLTQNNQKPAAKKVSPKYKFKLDGDKTYLWSGRGRTPVVVREHLEATGTELSDYLIAK